MQSDIEALDNHTWDLVLLRSRQFVVESKRAYATKLKRDGSLDCYKFHMVAHECNQECVIDYEKTSAPVAKMATIRSIMIITAVRG